MEKNNLRVLCACAILSLVSSQNVLELISSDAELTQFYKLINSSETFSLILRYAEVTVFAPTDDAFRKYNGRIEGAASGSVEDLLDYHVVTSAAVTSDRFPVSLPSQLPGGLPVWVTKRERPSGLHANNAEIVRGDIKGQSEDGSEQVLHVIDEVLEPTLPVSEDFRNPTALQVLTNPSEFGISDDVTAFQRKLNEWGDSALFEGGSGSTFFVPLDGLDDLEEKKWNEFVEGHVVPERVLFARAFPRQLKMASRDDVIRVVRMRNEPTGYEVSVASVSRVGGNTEEVRVVRANLPVQNGVVHLIERPLVPPGRRVLEVLEETEQLSRFLELLRKYEPDLLELPGSEMTVFAPTNRAFAKADPAQLERVYSDRERVNQKLELRIKRVLELHVSPGKFGIEQVVPGTTVIPTMDPARNLSFRFDSILI